MRDEREYHGAVDEYSSEQQIRESANYTLSVRKNWSPRPSATGSYGRQAGRETKSSSRSRFLKFPSEQTWKHQACLNEDITFLVALLALWYVFYVLIFIMLFIHKRIFSEAIFFLVNPYY